MTLWKFKLKRSRLSLLKLNRSTVYLACLLICLLYELMRSSEQSVYPILSRWACYLYYYFLMKKLQIFFALPFPNDIFLKCFIVGLLFCSCVLTTYNLLQGWSWNPWFLLRLSWKQMKQSGYHRKWRITSTGTSLSFYVEYLLCVYLVVNPTEFPCGCV